MSRVLKKRGETAAWLKERLGVGVHATKDVREAAEAAGFSWETIKVVKVLLGVESFRLERFGSFFMCMPGVEHPADCEQIFVEPTDKAVAGGLMVELSGLGRLDGNGSGRVGMLEQVEWVAGRLCLPMSALKVEDIPCGSALSLLLWAKSHEREFRHKYDMKRLDRAERVARAKEAKGASVVKVREPAPSQAAIDRLLKNGGHGQ